MKYFIRIALICFVTNCFSQNYRIYNGDTINRTLNDTIKVGKWIEFQNEKPYKQFEYYNNKKNGTALHFYPNGKIRMKLSYLDDKLEGVALIYSETTGEVMETGVWQNNRWEGAYSLYYPKGGIKQSLTFNPLGVKEGIQKYYYENGIIESIYLHQNGKQIGFVNFDQNGKKLGFNYIQKELEESRYYTFRPPSKNSSGDSIPGVYVLNYNKDGKSIIDATKENKELFVDFIENMAKMENAAIFQRDKLFKTQLENQNQKLNNIEKLRQIDLLTQTKSIQESEIKTNQLELEKEKILKEKKSKEITVLNQEKELKDTELKQQSIVRNTFIAGFTLMLIIAGLSYRNFKRKQKDNSIITQQKHIVEEKQKEILDSIHYAKRIQKSLLPTEKYIQKSISRLKDKN